MIANCPPQDKLKSLSLGQLPEEQSDILLLHLENCQSCQHEISQLDQTEDSFLQQIKTAGESAAENQEGFETEEGCRIAVTRALAALATAENDGSANMPNVPNSIGEYDIVKPLGAGGMGHVYLGRHTKLSRPVAIKFIADHRRWDQTMHERFESEMRLIGGLKHPNIVVAHDAREVDGLAVLVTEYIDGMTVSEILKRTGKLETADACQIVGEVCKALSYIDSKGLVHRDIKPSNIMIDADGSVKLLDLGLARLQPGGELNEATEFTATGQAMGTADYVAPEQVNDARNVDIRADIYGLGCTFYKLLSGQAPFAGKHTSAFAKMNAHLSEVPESLDSNGLPKDLVTLIDRMLEKKPDGRPQSPADISARVEKHTKSADLNSLLAKARTMPALKSTGQTTTAELSAKPKTEGSFFNKHPWVTAIAGGLAAFAFGLWLGVVITVKKPDGTTVQVEVPDGSTAVVDEQGNIEIMLAGTDQKMSIPKEQVENRQAEGQVAQSSPRPNSEASGSLLEGIVGNGDVGEFNGATNMMSPELLEKLLDPGTNPEASGSLTNDRLSRYVDKLIMKLDLDRDGVLNEEEAKGFRRPQNADGNGDGFISSDELYTAWGGSSTGDAGFNPTSLKVDKDSPVHGKVEKGDKVDVLVTTDGDKGRVQVAYSNYEVTGIRQAGTWGVPITPDQEYGSPYDITIDHNSSRGQKFITQGNITRYWIDFHDPERLVQREEEKLSGVWRAVLKKEGDKMSEVKRTLLLHRNNWIDISEDAMASDPFSVNRLSNNKYSIKFADGAEHPIRFTESGRLEIGGIRSWDALTRYELVTTPVSKEEKAAFEMLALSNQAEAKFECYIAEPSSGGLGVPAGAQVVPYEGDNLFLIGEPLATNQHVTSATVFDGPEGLTNLQIELDWQAGWLMGVATTEHLGKNIAVVVDGEVITAPRIKSAINGSLLITEWMQVSNFGTRGLSAKKLTEIANTIVPELKIPPSYAAGTIRHLSAERLRGIMLACHNYQSMHGQIPTESQIVNDGKHPVSWRVAILPFFAQQETDEIYAQYDFNQPWDSEANKKLLNRMPDIYRHPSSPEDSTTTNYVGIAGKNAWLTPDGRDDDALMGMDDFDDGFDAGTADDVAPNSFARITDGTANTVFMIESNADIPWTKPQDFQIESLMKDGKPDFEAISQLEFLDESGLGCATGDAGVHFLDRKKLIPETKAKLEQNGSILIKLFLINDGAPEFKSLDLGLDEHGVIKPGTDE